ncbi:hypothetical protein Scep_028975 [Stephania cephalantha]|uniref:Protein FAR1-RELATED SEQUENCE n=1 Tax=Stephania cephalantha TaxID=152367 RepID=A0AAP0HIN4_9MAGN
MFRKRHKWVPVYSRHIFHADMTKVHRMESISSFFDGFLNDSLPLSEFLKLSEKALAYRREQEINEDFQSHQTRPILKLNIPMEDQAANIYTGAAFKEFHKELCESLNYIVEETARAGTNWEYAVSRWGQNRSFLVNFSSCDNDIHVICNCQNFKFAGFLCRHIFKVFIVRNIMLIPHKYFKKRWTKRAKSGVASSDSSSETGSQTSLSLCYNDLCQLSLNFCAKAAVSIDAFRTAKHDIEIIIRELEKVAEEDMCVTQPDIEQIRSLHLPVEVVNNIGSSNHILTEENQTLSSANQMTLPNPTRLGDKRTGFWLRL